MVEARRLKTGRWRIYKGPDRRITRDPQSGAIATFQSLSEARRWWAGLNPDGPALKEAPTCARCGGYFGSQAELVLVAGRSYHPGHAPRRR
jgi:hypothetical protein